MLLETMACHSRPAYTGKEAIAAINDDRPDVVLLEIGLPDIDGHAVATYLIAHMTNPPPLVGETGSGQPKDREQSWQSGFHAHMTYLSRRRNMKLR